jgi:hypothetical protein
MERVFLTVLNMSLTGSYVIAVIIAARFLLRGAPRGLSYALWLAAGLRLVFPFAVESLFSLLPFDAAPIGSDFINPVLPSPGETELTDRPAAASLPLAVLVATKPGLPRTGFWWLSLLWLAGFLFMLLYCAVSAIILRKRLNDAVPLAGAGAWMAANLQTPFIFGLFRPRVYVPALAAGDLACVIRHEQAHIRRGDHWVKLPFTNEPALILTKTPADYALTQCQAYKTAAATEKGIRLEQIHISPYSITIVGRGFDNKQSLELELANYEIVSLNRGKHAACGVTPQGTELSLAFYTKIDPVGCRAIIVDGTRMDITMCDYYPVKLPE